MQFSNRLRIIGITLFIFSCIYPSYLLVSGAVKDPVPPIDISLPTNRRLLKIPFTIKTTSAYIPYVVANSGQGEERIMCLIQFSPDGCLKKLVPLTFDWKISNTSSGGAIAQGQYGNRNDYFSPFVSGVDDKNHIVGCEFAWLDSLRNGQYELVLTNLFVPDELTFAKPRLRMEIHNNSFELLNCVPGLGASFFACLAALVILIIDVLGRRFKHS